MDTDNYQPRKETVYCNKGDGSSHHKEGEFSDYKETVIDLSHFLTGFFLIKVGGEVQFEQAEMFYQRYHLRYQFMNLAVMI